MFPDYKIVDGGPSKFNALPFDDEQNEYIFEAMTVGTGKTIRSKDYGLPPVNDSMEYLAAFSVEAPTEAEKQLQ